MSSRNALSMAGTVMRPAQPVVAHGSDYLSWRVEKVDRSQEKSKVIWESKNGLTAGTANSLDFRSVLCSSAAVVMSISLSMSIPVSIVSS